MNFIKEIRESKNIKQSELAKKIGLTKGSLSLTERGLIGLSQDKLNKISKVLNCSVSQLLGEAMIGSDMVYNIKYYDIINNFCENINDCDFITISEKFLKLLQIKNYKNLIILKANEKNMEPAILNNDFLIVDITKKEPFNNKIYVIKERNLLKIKRITMKSPQDQKVVISSDNETDGEFPPYPLTIDEFKDSVVGQIVFFGRNII